MIVSGMTSFGIEEEMNANRDNGRPNVTVIPTGSIEQHGPLLPLNADSVIADAAARALDDLEGGRLFVYPPLVYTHAGSGMNFPGNLSVSSDTFRSLIREITASVQAQRFDALLFLDAHATNQAGLFEVAFETVSNGFQEQRPFPVMVLTVYQYFAAIREKHQLDIGVHADWFERLLFKASGGVLPEDGAIDRVDPYPDKVDPCPGIVGIPMTLRSDIPYTAMGCVKFQISYNY